MRLSCFHPTSHDLPMKQTAHRCHDLTGYQWHAIETHLPERKSIWSKPMLILSRGEDMKWLMTDAAHIKVHHHTAGAKGGNEGISYTKGAEC